MKQQKQTRAVKKANGEAPPKISKYAAKKAKEARQST